jgi:hypothetical protein
LAKEYREQSVPTAYVSLFGLTTIAEVKAAVVNDTVLNSGVEESTVKKVLGWGTKQLPGVLQALDKKVGFELLSRNLDLTRLIRSRTVICLDDLERISDCLKIEDVLGLAGLLAEARGARVLLVMNDEHLEKKHQDYAALLRAYRERVVRLSLRIEPNISAILPTLSVVTRSSISDATLTGIGAIMQRSNSTNIRTLIRILEQVVLLTRALGVTPRVEHLEFLAALTIEDAEGTLKSYDHYDFHPVVLAFEGRDLPGTRNPPDERQLYRRRFFERYFSSKDEYAASKGIYDLVVKGYPDAEKLRLEMLPRTETLTPAQNALKDCTCSR